MDVCQYPIRMMPGQGFFLEAERGWIAAIVAADLGSTGFPPSAIRDPPQMINFFRKLTGVCHVFLIFVCYNEIQKQQSRDFLKGTLSFTHVTTLTMSHYVIHQGQI